MLEQQRGKESVPSFVSDQKKKKKKTGQIDQ